MKGRCPQCAVEAERQRTVVREVTEPWRRLYRTAAWRAARKRVLRRDGRRCRAQEHGERCTAVLKLEVHHRVPTEMLYRTAESWDGFVESACDEAFLVTLCPSHHRRLERLHAESRKAGA